MKRRAFFKNLTAAGIGLGLSGRLKADPVKHDIKDIIKPPRLRKGDTIGLIAPASGLFETNQIMIEAREKMESLGFKVKFGNNVRKKWGYLAGSDRDRVQDIHDLFEDHDVRAIITIRGGYGSGRLLRKLDYKLIRENPKILLGYSDITSLLLGIYKMTGLVTFHGPVAISTFTDYTQKYFYKILTEAQPAGEIEDAPYSENLQISNRVWTVNSGKSRGRLTGGNLTLLCTTLGTPFEIDTKDKILFIEEVGEEPYDLDRMLTHLYNAGKLEKCAGVVFDRMPRVKTSSHLPSFSSSLSVEDVIGDRFSRYDYPVCFGLSLGHISDKPVMPLGIQAEVDADTGKISLLESAVQQ